MHTNLEENFTLKDKTGKSLKVGDLVKVFQDSICTRLAKVKLIQGETLEISAEENPSENELIHHKNVEKISKP